MTITAAYPGAFALTLHDVTEDTVTLDGAPVVLWTLTTAEPTGVTCQGLLPDSVTVPHASERTLARASRILLARERVKVEQWLAQRQMRLQQGRWAGLNDRPLRPEEVAAVDRWTWCGNNLAVLLTDDLFDHLPEA